MYIHTLSSMVVSNFQRLIYSVRLTVSRAIASGRAAAAQRMGWMSWMARWVGWDPSGFHF